MNGSRLESGRQFCAAIGAEIGGGRGIHSAGRADQVRLFVAPMNDQVANVRNPGERIGEDEDGVSLAEQGVTEEQKRADQAQPPECRRHHHLFLSFSRIPLHEETREKSRVAQPADHFPDVPLNTQKLSIVPEQVREEIHHSASSFSTFFSSSSRPFMSRSAPFLSTSHMAGILLMPNWRPNWFCQPSPSKYCGQVTFSLATNFSSAAFSWSKLMPTISKPLG